MATPLNISLKVTGLEQAKAELQTLSTIGQRSFSQLEAQAQRLSARMQQTDASLTGAATRVLQLAKAVDASAAANLSYRDSLVAINTALREGWINLSQQRELTAALRAEQQKLATSIRAVTDDIRQLGRIGTQGFNTILSSATAAARGVRPTGEAVLTLAQNMRTLVAELNPAAAANQKLYQTIMQVRQAAAGPKPLITSKEEAAIITQLRAEFDKTLTQIRAVKAEMKDLATFRGMSTSDIQTRAAGTTGTPKAGSQAQLDLATEMQGLQKAADPAAAANQALYETFVRLKQAVDGYVISQEEADRIEAHLVEQHNALANSIQRTASEIRELGTIGSATYADLESDARRLAAANQTAGSSYDALLKRVQANIEKVNPLATANQRLRNSIAEIRLAESKGDVDSQQATDSIEKMTQAHSRWVAQQKSALPTLNGTTLSHKQLGAVATQLSFQLNDVATGLAMGVNPMTILAQQGGQLIQVFQGLGPGGVGAVVKQFGAMIVPFLTNPITLAVIAVGALAIALGVLMNRLMESQQAVREFGVTLKGMDAIGDANGLEKMAADARMLGITIDEARGKIKEVIRAGITPAASGAIMQLGADLGAVMGKDQTTAIVNAFKGGTQAAIDYGLEVKALTVDQAKFADSLARAGKVGEAYTFVLKTMSDHSKGLHKESLSPMAEATLKLSVAWNQLMDSMSKSWVIQGLVTGFTKIIELMTKLANMPVPTWMGGIGPAGMPTPLPAGVEPKTGAAVVTEANRWVGLTEKDDASTLKGLISSVSSLDPQTAKWCAAFANAVLARQGLKGMTDVANSFQNWGTDVTGQKPMPGDIMVITRGLPAGVGGGHVGFATGNVAGNQMEMISGNRNAAVTRDWEPTANVMLRRADASVGAAGVGVAVDNRKNEAEAQQRIDLLIKEAKATRGVGFEQELATIRLQAETEATAKGLEGKARTNYTNGLIEAGLIRLREGIKNETDAMADNLKGSVAVTNALGTSAAAQKEAELRWQASTEAVAKYGRQAGAAMDFARDEFAKTRFEELKNLEVQKENQKLRTDMLQEKDTQAVLTLQTRLVGETTEEIAKQVTLLQTKQAIERDAPLAAQAEKDARLAAAAAATAEQVKHLADVQRQQTRIDDMYKKIGSTIESAIGDVIDGIFDPKKAMDWGKKVKDMALGLFKDFTVNSFKPLIGNLLGALGGSNAVVQSFGGNTGGATGGSNILGGGSLNIGTLFQGGSFLKDMFPETAKMFSSGINGAGGIGSSLGFGTTMPGLSVAELQGMGIPATEAMASFTAPGSLFGTTTLGSAAMGVGMGFAGGTMLNSLLGRKNGQQTAGMIGSGVGSLAGLALTPLLGPFGPILGGLAGGALGGMFGNPKGSNMSAGGNLDLANFKITGGFTGGDPKIDQQMATMGQTLQGFLALLQTTGGSLSGNVLLQSGVNTGITADSSLEGYAGRFNLGKDTDAAIKVIEQALVKSITGVSETMKTVLSQVGTDEDIAKAIQFAKAYDDIKTASENAFASVEDATTRIGPFGLAMESITSIFADLTTQATRFGLALDPINAALAEATERLQDDFVNAVQEGINAASGDEFINSLSQTIDNYLARTAEAARVGLEGNAEGIGDLMGQEFIANINRALEDLDAEQLTEVIQYFQGIVGDQERIVTDMAVAALAASGSTDDLSQSIEDLQRRAEEASKNIQSYIDQITATAGPSVSPEDAYFESQAQFAEQLAKAQTGDVEALESITEYADRLQAAIAGYYGSSEAGNTEFDAMVASLQGLVIPTQTAHLDPGDEAIVTGLTTLTNTVATDETMVGTTDAVTQGTIDAIASNNKAAQSIIDKNNEKMDALITASNETAATAISENSLNTEAAIAGAQAETTKLLADAETKSADLIAANDLNAITLKTANEAAATSIIEDAKLQTTDLLAAHEANTGLLIESTTLATTDLLDQAKTASEDALALTTEATGQIIQQQKDSLEDQLAKNDEATLDLLVGQDESTTALLESDGLTRESIIKLGEGSVAVAEVIDKWGEDLHKEIFNNADTVVKGIELWDTAIVTKVADSAKLIVDAIALWSPAIIAADKEYANNAIDSNTGLTNSIIKQVKDSGADTVATIATWFTSSMRDEKDLLNSIINTGLTYSNAQVIAATDGASSIIEANKTYANNAIADHNAWEGQNTYNWLRDIASYTSSTYTYMYNHYNKSIEMRQIMIDKLQDILNALNLGAQAPPPAEAASGGGQG